jgi:hypothetical protein
MTANPVDYVGKNLRGKHMVLLHEDARYAQLIEFSYLLTGLEQERNCVYLSYQEKGLARRKMRKRGIDVTHFEKREQLHIVRIYDDSFDLWDTMEDLTHRAHAFHGFAHSRIVWLFDIKRYDEKQLSAHIEEDSKVQAAIRAGSDHCSPSKGGETSRNFDGSILCSYPIDHKSLLGQPRILRRHLDNHDSIILAPRYGRGVVLQSDGLRKSDMEGWIRDRLEK